MSAMSLINSHEGDTTWYWSKAKIDFKFLPSSVDLAMPKIYAAVLIGIGGLWTVFSGFLFSEVRADNILVLLFSLVFPAIGIVILLPGLLGLIRKRRVTFNKEGVSVNDRRIFGSGIWSLPYSAFDGVLYRERVVSGKNSTTIYQIIELRHADSDKTIPLYVEATPDVPRARWEQYARQLDLPALSESAGQILIRRPEELDMSIHQLAQTGRLKVEHNDNDSPPRGLVVTRDHMDGEPVLNVAIKVPRYPYWLSGLGMGVPFVLMIMGYMAPDGLFVSMFAFAFLLLAGLLFVPDLRAKREIEVTKKFLTATDPLNASLGQSLTLKLEDIEEITIARQRIRIGHELMLITDDDQISVGAGLSMASLNWLRNYLIAAIARA